MATQEAVSSQPDLQATSPEALADELVSQAREAAAIFTQYGQEEVDRIVDAAAKAGISRSDFQARVRQMAEVAFDDQCVGANPSYPLVDELVRVFWEAYGPSPEA